MKLYLILLCALSTSSILSMEKRKQSQLQGSMQPAHKLSRQDEWTDIGMDRENHDRILQSIACWGAIFKSYSQHQNQITGQ